MTEQATETITRFLEPKDHFVFLMSVDGEFLLPDEKNQFSSVTTVSDSVVWRQRDGALSHHLSEINHRR